MLFFQKQKLIKIWTIFEHMIKFGIWTKTKKNFKIWKNLKSYFCWKLEILKKKDKKQNQKQNPKTQKNWNRMEKTNRKNKWAWPIIATRACVFWFVRTTVLLLFYQYKIRLVLSCAKPIRTVYCAFALFLLYKYNPATWPKKSCITARTNNDGEWRK
jgi:hypothetical protein